MNKLKPTTLRNLKMQASFLLKELNCKSGASVQVVNRFLEIPFFSRQTTEWMLDHPDSIQLKHSYQVIAIESGFKSWTELKQNVIQNDCLYNSRYVGFIHNWFNDYSQAEIYFNKHGGYLISFWKDFAVCGNEYIARIGLSQYEKQWESIGYNWVVPRDMKAFLFLKEKAAKNYEAKQ